MNGIHVELSPAVLTTIAGIPITNTLVTSWAVMIILAVVGVLVSRNISLIPSKFQTTLEWAFGYVYDYVTEVLESRDLARKYFPFLMTIFLFIFLSNLLEFTPGVGSVGWFKGTEFTPLFRSVNTDLNVTETLAIIVFTVVEIAVFAVLGTKAYLSKFFVNPFKSAMGTMVGIIELIGEFVRLISLSFRLFGNILAGEVLIIVATYFAPYFGPVPLMMFELFIGFLQAAIFMLLALFYIKLAITEAHDDSH
jgi:F-type H+-transporting ATPase subunit a